MLRFLKQAALGVSLSAAAVLAAPRLVASSGAGTTKDIPPSAFRIIESESGKDNYYKRVDGPLPHIHAEYKPPYETAVMGYEIPEKLRRSVSGLEWKWRAVTLPEGGNECAEGKGDSAAVIYVTWKRGLKWYSVKYVWSAVGPKGKTCRRKNNLFRAQDTVIVESGEPLNEWRKVRIDPDKEFRNHFEGGDKDAEVPDLVGIGIMSDGDQTGSVSSADYGGFVLTLK